MHTESGAVGDASTVSDASVVGGGSAVGAGSAAGDELAVGDELRLAGGALAREAARFAALGWMRATSGNLSVVLRREPLRLAITATGLDKGELSETDVVVVDGDGRGREGDRQPSAEAPLHARIARLTGANAVVHIHSLAPVIAAGRWPDGVEFANLEILKALGRGAEGDRVRLPVIANSQDMTVLGERFEGVWHPGMLPAVVVAAHGLYAWGRDLPAVRRHVEAVQWLVEWALQSQR